MDANGEKRRRIEGGKSEDVIRAPLNAGAEYMNTGSSGNQGEKMKYVAAVRQVEFRHAD